MSPRTQAQFTEMRETRRLQIMEAALELFATDGYGHCTISRLAAHAGISKGLMYNYFPSKEALLAAIIEHGLNEIMNLFDPDHDGVLKSDELVSFIRRVFAAMREHQEFWIMFISVIMQPKVKEHLKDKPIIRYLDQFISMLMEYFEKKGFEDPYLEIVTLSALIEGFGVLLIYAYPTLQFPAELMVKFENRIIDMYK
jgi:AcrR family transcriptional regulator